MHGAARCGAAATPENRAEAGAARSCEGHKDRPTGGLTNGCLWLELVAAVAVVQLVLCCCGVRCETRSPDACAAAWMQRGSSARTQGKGTRTSLRWGRAGVWGLLGDTDARRSFLEALLGGG